MEMKIVIWLVNVLLNKRKYLGSWKIIEVRKDR